MAQKPSIPKGTRDFGPSEMAVRNYIFNTVRGVFSRYGYAPIETPAMENLSTLLGKYGDEGDKLLFKILNSGYAFKDVDENDLTEERAAAASVKVCEKGLRYDLTVPFARYVVQHRSELAFPFKRYQIQPVWRADRPQKGRYREFYQCDVDVIGSKSMLNELELVQIVDEVFAQMGIRVVVKINNRKILSGLAEVTGQQDKLTDITVAIDKIDKIGLEAVKAELLEREVTPESISILEPVLTLSGTFAEKLQVMRGILASSQVGMKGLDEVEELFGLIAASDIATEVELDLSLARGLNYYTGAIFEVKALDFAIGSICGGGRYDDLTGIFGLADTSGVGISFGADRIYDVIVGLGLLPENASGSTEYLFVNMGGDIAYIMPAIKALRAAGHSCEIYPDNAKLRKQFEYADKKGIRYIVMAGEEEMAANELSVKDMVSGEQKKVRMEDIAK